MKREMAVALKSQQTRSKSDVSRKESRKPSLRVIEGKSSRPRGLSVSSLRAAFVATLVCLALFSALGGFRVYLASRASVSAIEAAKLQTQISDAYERANELELKQSILAQPDRIKVYAQANLGMGPAVETSHVDIGEDEPVAVASIPDDAFGQATPSSEKDANPFVEFVRSIFVPSEAGAALVTAP